MDLQRSYLANMQGAVDARFESPKSLFLPSQLRENCVAGGSHFGGRKGLRPCLLSFRQKTEGRRASPERWSASPLPTCIWSRYRPTDPLFSHGCTWLTLISQEKPPPLGGGGRFSGTVAAGVCPAVFFGCWLGRVKMKVSPSCSFFSI